MRGGDKESRFPEALRDVPFMLGIHKGKQQGKRDGFNSFSPEGLDEGRQRAFGQGLQHATAMVEPFLHFQAPVLRHERGYSATEPIIEISTGLPADLQYVSKPLGRDERGTRSLAFEQRVGGHGRAVHHAIPGGRGQSAQPFQHRLSRIGGSREHLEGVYITDVMVVDHEIGEGAADVDADGKEGSLVVRTHRLMNVFRKHRIEAGDGAPGQPLTCPLRVTILGPPGALSKIRNNAWCRPGAVLSK